MKNFKFLLGITLCATMLMSFGKVLGVKSLQQPVYEHVVKADGDIVMTDVIMAVTVNEGEGSIHNVVVSSLNGEPVYQENGCGTNHCLFDLSGITPGTYFAIAYTEQGGSISATIQL